MDRLPKAPEPRRIDGHYERAARSVPLSQRERAGVRVTQ